jgi:hypothetical protein
MSEGRLAAEDREEISYALKFKACGVERGEFDEFHGEAARPALRFSGGQRTSAESWRRLRSDECHG